MRKECGRCSEGRDRRSIYALKRMRCTRSDDVDSVAVYGLRACSMVLWECVEAMLRGGRVRSTSISTSGSACSEYFD